MKIAIDVSQVVYGTGVSNYTKSLVTELLKIDKENNYLLFGNAWRRKTDLESFFQQLEGDFEKKILSFPPTLAEKFFNRVHTFSIDRFVGEVDILHTSDWIEPKTKAKKVTTVHDLVPILFPEISDENIVRVHKKKLELVKRETDIVIVPSHTTKKDLMKQDVQSNRIRVVPEAPDDIFQPANERSIKSVKQKYNLKKEYVFSVGITKRKNTQLLIDAFQQMELDNLDLVITGHPYTELSFKDNIKLLGHVDWTDLPALYSGALVFVYPSFYEGFGLPILEAMACNTPVITSDIGSMKEIAEGAAILVDPRKENEIIDAILLAIKKSNQLKALGRKRVKSFTWERTAKETLEVYKEVYNEDRY